MKSTGMVRRIDNVGRVVIPKEILKTLSINNRDQIEFYISNEGDITLKKYNPIPQAFEQIEILENLIIDGTSCTPEVAGKAMNLLKEVKKLLQG